MEQKSGNCNNLVSVGEAKKGTSVTWWSVVPHLVPAVCNFLASTPSAFLNDDSASTNKPRCSSRPSSTAARLVLPRNMSKRLTTCSKACSYASKFWILGPLSLNRAGEQGGSAVSDDPVYLVLQGAALRQGQLVPRRIYVGASEFSRMEMYRRPSGEVLRLEVIEVLAEPMYLALEYRKTG